MLKPVIQVRNNDAQKDGWLTIEVYLIRIFEQGWDFIPYIGSEYATLDDIHFNIL